VVITDDVPQGVSAEAAGKHIQLVLLVNDVSLRNLIPNELAKGFGFFHAKPSSAFSPVAVTPDELGNAWNGGSIDLALLSYRNGEAFGRPNCRADMTFDFRQLIAHAAKTRPLSAGTLVGSGTVSNKDADGGPGRPVGEGGLGYACVAEIRTVETIRDGKPATAFLKYGERVKIEMLDASGKSIFGAIDQEIVRYQNPA
jgi:fumarylacetoacetate (FAA) hydrolase